MSVDRLEIFFYLTVTIRVLLVVQELLTLREHMGFLMVKILKII